MANAIDFSSRSEWSHLAAVPTVAPTGGAYREATRELAGSVSLITVGVAPRRTGFTATSVTSLSVDPPRLMFSADRLALAALERCRCFGVNVLAAHQSQIAARFTGRAGLHREVPFAGECWHAMTTGASLLCEALAAFDCELEETIVRHSQAIVIGRVVATRRRAIGAALVQWRGDYRGLASDEDPPGLAQWEPILRSRNVGCS